MKYRKLRIAWSVAWGVVAVLLVVLWVRSYRRFDFYYPPHINARVTSGLGVLGIQAMDAHEKRVLESKATLQSLTFAELIRRGAMETHNLSDLFLSRISSSQLFARSTPRYNTRLNSTRGRIDVESTQNGNWWKESTQNRWWKKAIRRATFVPGMGYSIPGETVYFDAFGNPMTGLRKFHSSVHFPHWFAVTVFAAVGALPWMRWSKRFSLRTLLIATTLIAVGLGLAVYAMR